jgi:aminopeptidase N
MLRNVAVDLAKSLHFYEWYFGTELPTRKIYASRIGSNHGQAFDGFIHLSNYTFDQETSGAAELFRAHEAAHQYWGHLVGWKSYRDQWLSEGFAEYSSMLYVQATMEKTGYFEEILDVYFAEQLGTRGADMSRFARPWYQLEYQDIREDIGPIGVGYRASTAMVPYGYAVQAYNKGALVLHMLRMMLHSAFGSDDTFRAFLKDFLQTYAGKAASTDDLAATLSKHVAGDWGWFFDQWVYGTAIPTYAWEWSAAQKPNADGKYPLTITVRQSGVPEGFRMPVPVEVNFGGKSTGRVTLGIDQPEETFTINLPRKPKKVTFNPDRAVLANVKKM